MTQQHEHWVASGDLRLYAVAEGNPQAPALVLVHGYPDDLRVWDRLVPHLRDHFYLIRYDVRGAGRSDKPARTADYRLSTLANDLKAVTDTVIPGRHFHLAAHDWGSIQSWEAVGAAGALQTRILSFTSISGPCIDHVAFWLRDHSLDFRHGGAIRVARQLASSWYVFLFQLPGLAERLWHSGLDRRWPDWLARDGVEGVDVSPFQQADGRYGVKLYRANFLPRLWRPRTRIARCPVQLIIPTRDRYVRAQLFDNQVRWTGKLERIEIDAHHWLQLTHPEWLAQQLAEFAHRHSRAGTKKAA